MNYVLCYAHPQPHHWWPDVLLIRKNKPDWQRGLYNLPGGKIEISVPQLVAGQLATVIVKVENEQPEKLTITERLARANVREIVDVF